MNCVYLALLVNAALHDLGTLLEPRFPSRLTPDNAQRREGRLCEPKQIEMGRRRGLHKHPIGGISMIGSRRDCHDNSHVPPNGIRTIRRA